jgi:quercetin dioxygenase-like cupin family protein
MPDTPVQPHPPVDLGGGVTRRILAESPEMMVVEVAFGKGASGAPHSHPHVQSCLVKSGRFEFTIDGRSFEVGPGDAFIVPSGAEHGCRNIEAGVLIDTFTPRRDDFL